ncbi:HAD family hydrolase [Ruminococcus sp.]|uniref:HAD family hydrolase n=1 Tax=Ruminococcus sp. TaxID=41978 RepID=UPI001B3D9314|nr:HAD family hydrolase [Ruminococcus sp.]MBP5430723.1 HAD family hydrolase [Ruminococcus sp.]
MKKLAVFDLDGTLADTICDLGNAVNYGLMQLGCPTHDYALYKKMVGNGARKLCFRALPNDRKDMADELYLMFKGYYSHHYLDKTKLYDGMRETIRRLYENGVILAVATNKPEEVARDIVATLLSNIDFLCVLGGGDKRPLKPDPAVIFDIYGLLPDDEYESYMIGDSNVDVMTACNADIGFIGCSWGFRGRDELEASISENRREMCSSIAEKPSDIADFILY